MIKWFIDSNPGFSKNFPEMDGDYYVSDRGRPCLYLHKDGTYHPRANYNDKCQGWFKDWEAAQMAIDKFNSLQPVVVFAENQRQYYDWAQKNGIKNSIRAKGISDVMGHRGRVICLRGWQKYFDDDVATYLEKTLESEAEFVEE